MSAAQVKDMEQATLEALEGAEKICYLDKTGNISLLIQPQQYCFWGSSKPDIGTVVQAEDMLPSEGLLHQSSQSLLHRLLPHTPWLGIYQKV
jgi:hypothetical protein